MFGHSGICSSTGGFLLDQYIEEVTGHDDPYCLWLIWGPWCSPVTHMSMNRLLGGYSDKSNRNTVYVMCWEMHLWPFAIYFSFPIIYGKTVVWKTDCIHLNNLREKKRAAHFFNWRQLFESKLPLLFVTSTGSCTSLALQIMMKFLTPVIIHFCFCACSIDLPLQFSVCLAVRALSLCTETYPPPEAGYT